MSYLVNSSNATIKSGESDLIYSERICAVDNNVTVEIPTFSGIKNLKLVFRFAYDGGKLSASFSGNGDGRVVFDLKNFGSSLGSGFTQPVSIGTIDGRSLDIMLFVTKLPKGFPVLDLNIYAGENKNDATK